MKPGNFTQPLSISYFSFIRTIPVTLVFYILFTLPFLFCTSKIIAGDIIKAGTQSRKSSFASPLAGTESLRTNFYILNDNGTRVLADGVYSEYNNLYHDSVTLEDAVKFTNIKENLGMTRYGKVLAIERRPIIISDDTIFYKLWKTSRPNYQFEFIPSNLYHPGMEAHLLDAYLGTRTPLSLTSTNLVNVSIDINPASADVNRFKIVFHTSYAFAPLPVTFTSLKGYENKGKVYIDWMVANEINVAGYEVERSANGQTFSPVNSIAANATGRLTNNYTVTDENPLSGNNYYRVKSVDRDGVTKYSTVVKINTAKKLAAAVSIYPNPIKGNAVNLQFINQPSGTYQLRLLNNMGQVVYTGKLMISSNNSTQTLYTNTKLAGGMYQLEIMAPDKTVQVKQAMVQE